MQGTSITLAEFFDGNPQSRKIFDRVWSLAADCGAVQLRVTRSQIAFRRRKAFAWAWAPARYLRGKVAPLVLSIARRRRDASPCWKEIVQVAPGRFMHHLELASAAKVDEQVRAWLQEAWQEAG